VDINPEDFKDKNPTGETIRKILSDYARNQEITEEATKQVCQLFYYRYQAFIEAGFSESQAFELIKLRGLE